MDATTTTRPITFAVTELHTRLVTDIQLFPAGTKVYARPNRKGRLTIRVCGTLFEQDVYPAAVMA